MQAANTSLTGGSSPACEGYDRDIVIVSTTRIRGIIPIDGGRQVICLPGTTLHELERVLRPFGREPHSVIGSTCFGASVVGGVCNNSGGSLVRRGPAYTELALYARVDETGTLSLVNHLGVALGEDPLTMLRRLDRGDVCEADIEKGLLAASDRNYECLVRDVDANTPARFNADQRRLFEASGSAGKLAIFAVRLDTFEAEKATRTFYIGSEDEEKLSLLRRTILRDAVELPIAAEYLHRDAFDLADCYGKDQFLLIEKLGTDALPYLFALKSRLDDFASRHRWLPTNFADRLLHALGRLWPDHLPTRLRDWRMKYAHHLILKVSAKTACETRELLEKWKSAECDYFDCSSEEASKAFLHRFVIAGAAVRFQSLHREEVEDVVALDVALRRNDTQWIGSIPPEVDSKLLHRIYYGHFLCHVMHQDFVVTKGTDCAELKKRLLNQLDERGARYPAEHNVGHQYTAPPELAAFYRSLDPINRFNPGIGGSSKLRNYADQASSLSVGTDSVRGSGELQIRTGDSV